MSEIIINEASGKLEAQHRTQIDQVRPGQSRHQRRTRITYCGNVADIFFFRLLYFYSETATTTHKTTTWRGAVCWQAMTTPWNDTMAEEC